MGRGFYSPPIKTSLDDKCAEVVNKVVGYSVSCIVSSVNQNQKLVSVQSFLLVTYRSIVDEDDRNQVVQQRAVNKQELVNVFVVDRIPVVHRLSHVRLSYLPKLWTTL